MVALSTKYQDAAQALVHASHGSYYQFGRTYLSIPLIIRTESGPMRRLDDFLSALRREVDTRQIPVAPREFPWFAEAVLFELAKEFVLPALGENELRLLNPYRN